MSVVSPLEDPSKQIRLLKPRPTSFDNALAFDISVWNLDDVPEYNAISYTWGDAKEPSKIPELVQTEAEQITIVERLKTYMDPAAVTQAAHDEFCDWLDEVEPRRNLAHMQLYATFGRPLRREAIVDHDNRPTSTTRSNLVDFDFSGISQQITLQVSELQETRTTIRDARASERLGVLINDKWNPVRMNCCYVLQQATRHFPTSYIWIDSICINQADTVEKSSQVAVMFEIYQRATHVLAGLGSAADASGNLFAVMQIFHAIMRRFEVICWRWQLVFDQDWIWYRILSALDDMELASVVAAFRALCLRPYWERLWIVQEMFAGVHGSGSVYLMCGKDVLPYVVVIWFYELIDDDINRVVFEGHYSPLQKILRKRDHKQGALPVYWSESMAVYRNLPMGDILDADPSGTPGLLEGFAKYQNRQCADRRDLIYGLLSLVNWWAMGIAPMQPDYSKSALELALELCARSKPDPPVDCRGVLTGLSINANERDMKLLVQRQHELGSSPYFHPRCAIRDQIRSDTLYDKLRLVECVVLSTGQDGDLEIPGRTTCYRVGITINCLFTQLWHSRTEFKILKCSNETIGVVCPGAAAGDVLLRHWCHPLIAMVLRKSAFSPGKFDIVGQAVAVVRIGSNGLGLQSRPPCTRTGHQCTRFAAKVNLRLSVGDIMAMEGQDSLTVDDESPFPEERLERLAICPVAHRVGSVTLECEGCLGQTKFES